MYATKEVGLVQQEFVVANHIGIHPNVVLFPEKVSKAEHIIIGERSLNEPSPILPILAWETSSVMNIAVSLAARASNPTRITP